MYLYRNKNNFQLFVIRLKIKILEQQIQKYWSNL